MDCATVIFTFTSLWDNKQNSLIAEPEAQDNIYDLIREVQKANVRRQTQLDITRANAGVAGVASVEHM